MMERASPFLWGFLMPASPEGWSVPIAESSGMAALAELWPPGSTTVLQFGSSVN